MSTALSRRSFLQMIAASAATGAFLVACQPASPGTVSESGGVVPTAAKTDLRIVSGQDITEIEVRKQIGQMYELVNPNVNIEIDVISGARSDSQLTMIAGGNPPDILYLNDFFQYAFAHKGLLLELDGYIERDSFDFTPYLPEAVEANRYKGKMIAMPFEVSVAGVVYNKNLFDEAGVPYPTADVTDTSWNWDSMVEVAKALTDESKNQYGFSMDSWMIPNWLLCYDQRYISNNKEITEETHAVINAEPTAKVLQYWLDLRNVHKVSPTAAMSQEISGFDRFMSGKVAMYTYGRWLNTFRTIQDFEWDVAPMPAPKDGHFASQMYILNYGIYANSQKADLAWDVLKFLTTKEPQTANVLTGMAIAVLEEVNRSPEFLNNAPPANNKVYADTLPYAALWDNNESGFMVYANQVLGQLYSGERTDIDAVLQEASDGIDRALDEWRADNL
ncbi:MAG: ABC transporter substrate-binding protein [Chloroflexota bacterium]|nr:sugar ABC transporter substrate-binding protein [Caldilinea sp.]GIK72815.1 MAG: ABC transporter substrate-binding protein [Chloroflexota bacterium]